MKKLLTGLFFISLFQGVMAQQANYKLAEKCDSYTLPWGYERLIPFFVTGSDNFWFKQENGEEEQYYFVNVKAKKIEKLFDSEYIADEMTKVTGKTYNPKKLGFWGLPFDKTGTTLSWDDGKFRFEYNRVTQKLTHTLPDKTKAKNDTREMPAEMQKMILQQQGFSPDEKWQVFGKGCNAYLRNMEDSTEVQLTFDGEPGFSYAGEKDNNEVVNIVPVWFDDSKHFYHYRHDTRKIGEVFQLNYLYDRPSAYGSKIVLAGDSTLLHTEISLFDTETKQQKKVKIGKWQDQMSRILHSDTKLNKLYIERKTRRSNILEVCEVNLKSGEIKVIIREEGDPYIGTELASIHFLNNCNDIIWWSERDGHGHFYLYDGKGNLKNKITSGPWSAGHIVKIDEKKRDIYFQAYGITPGENPSYAKICKANIDGKGKIVILTPEEATHSIQFSPSGRYIIDTYSRPDLPYQFTLRDLQGRLVMKLAETNLNTLYHAGWKLPETFSVKAADEKTDLYGVMWKPFDFDPNKKYPVISCVYPGPQTDNVPLTFAINSMNEKLAQVGFIVVAFNHRGGLPYRGRDYHSHGYKNIRDHALADDKRGLEQLVERYSFIDGERIGIYGHSGGGMMSTAAICTYPDFYKACVSSAGNHDNNIYSQSFVEGHYEIHEEMRNVQEKIKTADGRDTIVSRKKILYTTNLPTNMELAKNLKGHLMLVVGGQDGNVHPANTIRMVNAFINHGKDFELVFLPTAGHTYDGISDWYFQHKLRSHFAKYLLGDFTTPCFYDVEIDQNYRLQ